MTLGQKIQSLRESQMLSQKDFAIKTGVTTGTVAEWESDEVVPDLTSVYKISKALSVSSDALLELVVENTSGTSVPVASNSSWHGRKKNRKAWVLIALLLTVLVVVAAACLLSGQSRDVTPTTQTTQATTTVEEPLSFSEDAAAIEEADASVVTIFCYDYEGELVATGSGFVAFDGKTIITNYHVMSTAYTCKISTNQDITYSVSGNFRYSKELDISIIRLSEDTGLKPLTLGSSSSLKKGEPVVAIGSPLGIKNTVSTGVLSGRMTEGNMDVLQFTAPISNGSSGGALFDNYGHVIGITYASYVDGQNINLAIPIELAIGLYEDKQRVLPEDLSNVYFEEYPHYMYMRLAESMNNNKEIPVVSLADLKQRPQEYDEKIVRLNAYVSSWGKGSQFWVDHGNWYVSEEQYVSGDYECDRFLDATPRSGVSYQDSPVLLCNTDFECSRYVDEAITPGDQIEIIAYFKFFRKGELLIPDEPEFDMCWEADYAQLESILVWES